MKSSLNIFKKSDSKKGKGLATLLLVFVIGFSIIIPAHEVKAQTVDPAVLAATLAQTLQDTSKTVWEKAGAIAKFAWQKAGSIAFQQTIRTAVNKIAYDTANWLGSGGKGQKPLFITEDWGTYLGKVVDEAGGEFIETFTANLTSSLNADSIATKCQNSYSSCALTCSDVEVCNLLGLKDCKKNYDNCISSCKSVATECNKTGETGDATPTSSKFIKVSDVSGLGVASTNICQPSSLEASLKISLGLVEQVRPGEPNCTATKMVQNWGDEVQRLTDFSDPYFSSRFTPLFDPISNDLGIAFAVRSDLVNKQVAVNENNKLVLAANKGWKDKTNIAKKLVGVPGEAEAARDKAGNLQNATFGQVTGDILVDAANIFLNQIALTAYNNLMANLGKKSQEAGSGNDNLINPYADPNIAYGEKSVKEATADIIKPDFGVQADYDILGSLASCPDKANPGPNNCVIDGQFMQAISEKRTVAEAIQEGYLNKDWQLTKNTLENNYSLRNISILRKYRILPIGWEEAAIRANASSTAIKKAKLGDLISCFSTDDSYGEYSKEFNVNDQQWCRGLIDPNWVLKAPLNYCSKKGIGSQVMSDNVFDSTLSSDGSVYSPSIYNVTRAEDYCADEKTCIKEKSDGSCSVYGYCNEEKRTWNFSSNSCQAINNTCNNFRNTTNNRQFSYLENTLDFRNCDASVAGCRQYSLSGVYNNNSADWDASKSIYFNKNIANCNAKDEGCTELIRVKPTWGANLIMDASFVNDKVGDSTNGTKLNDIPLYFLNSTVRSASIVDASSVGLGNSEKIIKITASGASAVAGVYSDEVNSLLPDNFQLVTGEAYTLSADVLISNGQGGIYLGDDKKVVNPVSASASWQHLTLTKVVGESFTGPMFGLSVSSVNGSGVLFYVKNLKLELSNFETKFDVYGVYKFYQKIIPPYLEKACYKATDGSDYGLKAGAPDICKNFSRKCNSSEVGCELYTSQKNGLKIPAQVISSDYCRKECVGYDMYISKASSFNESQSENIIPANSNTCSAEAVGCTEFTNLDEVAQGGEKREYYSALKHCIKPATNLCASFYSWEGTASGYQLRLYNLKKNNLGLPEEVGVVNPSLCNADIYNKSLGDPLYNSDCREFYSASGQVSYRLISKTITCSNDCHPYRMSVSDGAATTCLNGGSWDATIKACIYQAIPGEGKICSVNEKDCREYNGNSGNNLRIVSSYNFENGTQGWSSNCSGALQLSTISNNKDGHSIYYKNTSNGACLNIGKEASGSLVKKRLINQVFASDTIAAQLKVSSSVTKNKSYTVRFISKANIGDTKVSIYFYNNNDADPKRASFSNITVKGGGEWNVYQANLANLDHEVTAEEVLVITADKEFYFDEVVLTEITDRYYLIKNTSVIPDTCLQNLAGEYKGGDYNLGCAAYTDRDGSFNFLRKFSKLCSDSSVGCEQMIDTKNYSPYGAKTWDKISVPKDSFIYAIYDKTKKCNPSDKGCSRIGQAVPGGDYWSDVFKKVDPNLYDKILCKEAELGCEEWSLDDGSISYFKDPGTNACQYRLGHSAEDTQKAWYKIPVKRCDNNPTDGEIKTTEKYPAKICNSNSDCGDSPCIIDNNDYPCETSSLKTFGTGGSGNIVYQPSNLVGLCSASEASCSEYIDPVSRISPNLVKNPSYETSVGNPTPEDWDSGFQNIIIEKNKFYVLSTSGAIRGGVNLVFPLPVKKLNSNNNLDKDGVTSIDMVSGSKSSIIFTSLNNTSLRISGGVKGKTIELREVIINYQLKNSIDTKTCNGALSFDNGCILFNERSVGKGSGQAAIDNPNNPISLVGKYDATNSLELKSPTNCTDNCNANKLIKVRPDRTCSKWLDCNSYGKESVNGEKTCYSVGQCNSLNEDNTCASFEDVATGTIKYSDTGLSQNSTGYYLLNNYHIGNMTEVGLNSDAHFDFEDIIPPLSCIRIDGVECQLNNIAVDLLQREPNKSPVNYEGAHGKTYLKTPSSYLVSPQPKNSWIKVVSNKEYYLNLLVNTEKNSAGADVRLSFKNTNGVVASVSQTFYANNGWERKIFKFKPTADLLRIELTATVASSTTYAYFDDINIEPVLEVGKNALGEAQYVSRECRLYPTSDSLTCVNKNNNVLKNGFEGYCLVHDPNNQEVCLMWYPVDKISSTQMPRNESGYKGKFPLNYCTEVDGNFSLVKKLTFAPVLFDTFGNNATAQDNKNNCHYYTEKKWFDVPGGGGYSNGGDGDSLNKAKQRALLACPNDYEPIIATGEYNGLTYPYLKVACIPKKTSLLPYLRELKTVEDMDFCNGFQYYEGLSIYKSFEKKPYILTFYNESGDYDFNNTSPTNQGSITKEGGSAVHGKYVCDALSKKGISNPWCSGQYKGLDEAKNIEGSVRIFDYNNKPSNEDGLKYLSSNESEKNYRLTCNNFIQVVDSNGDNQAWAQRVSSLNPLNQTSTPLYYIDATSSKSTTTYANSSNSIHKIEAFSRNRQDWPFGASVWSDSFNILNSETAITLRNQYSVKNKEVVMAGRPYGCSNYKSIEGGEEGVGCNNIGYCSLDPNVYCLNSPLANASIQASVDDNHTTYLNGKKIGMSGDIDSSVYEVKLKEKEKNVLAIFASDTGGQWGIAAAINGVMTTNSTKGWKCSPTAPPATWANVDFDDSAWNEAVFVNGSCSNCASNFTGYKQIWDSTNNRSTPNGKVSYCRYTFINNYQDAYVSKQSCSGLGTCVPLWDKYLGANDGANNGFSDYQVILKNLFLKSFGSYSYSHEDKEYKPGGLVIDYKPPVCTNLTRGGDEFCYIKPKLENIKFNGKDIANNSAVNLTKKGDYSLSFTSKIDPEQQPLKQIYINWGDGKEQLITSQDSRSDKNNPHLFYHYYTSPGSKIINIKLTDNWDTSNQ